MMVMRAAYLAPFSRMRDDNYVIQYGQDPSYQDLSPLHTGPSQLLTPKAIPLTTKIDVLFSLNTPKK